MLHSKRVMNYSREWQATFVISGDGQKSLDKTTSPGNGSSEFNSFPNSVNWLINNEIKMITIRGMLSLLFLHSIFSLLSKFLSITMNVKIVEIQQKF